jgi:hypothetical protein
MRLTLPIALLAIALVAAGASAQQQLGAANYTVGYANATVASASAYVESVNQSGYLIFYPRLTQAYAYLDNASAIYNKSPDAAVLYAQEARASAQAQYGNMGEYRETAFAVMGVLTVVTGVLVALSMGKARGAGGSPRRTSPLRPSNKIK